jgi:hypothetical protein
MKTVFSYGAARMAFFCQNMLEIAALGLATLAKIPLVGDQQAVPA